MHRLWRLFSCPLGGALAVACVLVSLATHPADGRAGGVALHESSARRAATAAPAPGPMLRTVQLPAAPSDMLVDERTQRVFVICGPGLSGSMTSGSARSMVVLDAATGRLLRTISLGAHVVLG